MGSIIERYVQQPQWSPSFLVNVDFSGNLSLVTVDKACCFQGLTVRGNQGFHSSRCSDSSLVLMGKAISSSLCLF